MLTGEACKRQCMAQDIPMKCLGLDYNLALDKCYFHYDERDLLSTFPGEETNHYEKVTECPLSSECIFLIICLKLLMVYYGNVCLWVKI